VSPQVLAQYAGTYEYPQGRAVVVSIAGEQLVVQDSATPADRLYVSQSETVFMSSVSQTAIEFVRNGQGVVTHFVRTFQGKGEKAVRKDATKP
jgi:hypothetical protein